MSARISDQQRAALTYIADHNGAAGGHIAVNTLESLVRKGWVVEVDCDLRITPAGYTASLQGAVGPLSDICGEHPVYNRRVADDSNVNVAYACSLPAGHTPAEQHEDTSRGGAGRRWLDRSFQVVQNRLDRRNARKFMRRELAKMRKASQ